MALSSTMVSVVDDDVSVRRALARLFTAYGLQVETFASANDYLAADHHDGVACLVLDIHLGGMSGFELYERLAAAGTVPPTIIITANDDAPTRERVRQLANVEYFRKPFDCSDLIEAVQRATERGPS